MAVVGLRALGVAALRRRRPLATSAVDALAAEAVAAARAATDAGGALDILASVEAVCGSHAGLARLRLARADVEAGRGAWAAAADAAATAAEAAEAGHAGRLLLAAADAGARFSAAAGADTALATAAATAARAADVPAQLRDGVVAGLEALAAHAAGGAGAAADAAARADDSLPLSVGGTLASFALSRAAAVFLASGDADRAAALFARAASAAVKAVPACVAGPAAAADAAAAAGAGAAQALVAAGDSSAAEDAASAALAALDRRGRPAAAGLPLLFVLGDVFARSGRVMLAEGMLRRAGSLAGADPAKRAPASVSACHPSLAAAIAWRYAQLLTALPQRETEAAAWADAAADRGGGRAALEAALGGLPALTGQGDKGAGVVVDGACRRALPALGE